MADIELTDEQVRSLVSGGECSLHVHDFDRAASRPLMVGLQSYANFKKITTGPYTLTFNDDYLLVDSTAGAITVNVPLGRRGKEFGIIRVAGANNVTLTRTSPDTINGANTLAISASYTPVRLKYFKGTGWLTI